MAVNITDFIWHHNTDWNISNYSKTVSLPCLESTQKGCTGCTTKTKVQSSCSQDYFVKRGHSFLVRPREFPLDSEQNLWKAYISTILLVDACMHSPNLHKIILSLQTLRLQLGATRLTWQVPTLPQQITSWQYMKSVVTVIHLSTWEKGRQNICNCYSHDAVESMHRIIVFEGLWWCHIHRKTPEAKKKNRHWFFICKYVKTANKIRQNIVGKLARCAGFALNKI